jgi:hypothetical protein
VQQNIAQGSIS